MKNPRSSGSLAIFWFRRDLRLKDNKALYHALQENGQVLPFFLFDEEIISSLPAGDHRVSFIYDSLEDLNEQLNQLGSGLRVERGKPLDVFRQLCEELPVQAVYCNCDHETYGTDRDEKVGRFLQGKGIAFAQYLDHLIMEPDEVMKSDDSPYQVYTPYNRRWKDIVTDRHLRAYDHGRYVANFAGKGFSGFPSRKHLRLEESALKAPAAKYDEETIRRYDEHRDFPAREGTTRLGVHLRFGTVSIRELVRKSRSWNETFVDELIWREFYAMILYHYPGVVTRSFKPEYDRIRWRNNEHDFERWKHGQTGYPMVDAGMRQLYATGYIHNRLRMITASFLTKHLLVDWRWGEAWFGVLLFDYELSSNNGGWQWSAGTGCDAAPYFRIFNPEAQQKKFDPEGRFIREWIPELDTEEYPAPMVEHRKARERCLKTYRLALNKQE